MPDSKQTSRRVALFAGSFDPITNGHVDVVGKAVRLAERLVIAVGIHPGKTPLFSADDRLAMIDEVCAPLARAAGCELSVVTFADLVVTAAQRAGATMLVRGVRDATDFDYEMQMAGMNATMAPQIHCHFGAPDCQHGGRRFGLCPGSGRSTAEKKIRQGLNSITQISPSQRHPREMT